MNTLFRFAWAALGWGLLAIRAADRKAFFPLMA
jgi:hypothetical protein